MAGLTTRDWDRLKAETARVYAANEVEAGDAYFHMPNAHFYPSLFAWDSGFQAVAMCHLDPVKAARELATLFAQVAPDGHMPHEVLLPPAASRASLARNFTRWLVQWEYDSRRASHLVDPPTYVCAAEQVYELTGDRRWLESVWENLRRCLDYLADERDLFGDGLVTILHPWEAGTDLSPQFFEALGVDPRRDLSVIDATLYAIRLYRFCNRRGWDPTLLFDENRFAIEDLTVNCITVRALLCASRLASEVGDELTASNFRSRARSMADAIDRICWDEGAGCYFPRWNAAQPRLSRVKTAASLLPLFTGLCDAGRATRLVKEHLLDPDEFAGEYVVPFNPEDELAGFRPWVEKKLWAAHCIWINFNWMLAIGLAENGFEEEARRVTESTAELVGREGFWEYYDSRTGEGRRMRDFTWPGLVLDMIARHCPEALPTEG
ncbi:MAG: hypothetical protein KJ993_04075 [Actinobacteria bacterium]|nr:hypothetical protein [Actinomycetota bacterium]